MTTKFWVEDPCVLISDLQLCPTQDMTRNQKFNALTRLAIIITIVLYFMEYDCWLTFLVATIASIVVLYQMSKTQTENFTIVPTYLGADFPETVVAPTYAEEHRVQPPVYDQYVNIPESACSAIGAEDGGICNVEYMSPRSYPYGQYITTSNMLPSDEMKTHMGDGTTEQAKEYFNSSFLRHDLAFRDNMTRILKKKLQRRFAQNCQDTYSPFCGY